MAKNMRKHSGWEFMDIQHRMPTGGVLYQSIPIEELRPRRTFWQWLIDLMT